MKYLPYNNHTFQINRLHDFFSSRQDESHRDSFFCALLLCFQEICQEWWKGFRS
jgi:hypothetical protein